MFGYMKRIIDTIMNAEESLLIGLMYIIRRKKRSRLFLNRKSVVLTAAGAINLTRIVRRFQ